MKADEVGADQSSCASPRKVVEKVRLAVMSSHHYHSFASTTKALPYSKICSHGCTQKDVKPAEYSNDV